MRPNLLRNTISIPALVAATAVTGCGMPTAPESATMDTLSTREVQRAAVTPGEHARHTRSSWSPAEGSTPGALSLAGGHAPNLRRVLIHYGQDAKSTILRELRERGAVVHHELDELATIAATVPARFVDELAARPEVEYVEEDAARAPLAQVVPYGIDLVQARDVWDIDRNGAVDSGAPTGAGIGVCIIDSGLYTGHEDFAGVNVLGGTPSGWSSDLCGHGTHVAGTIAAANNSVGVVGVTPGTVNLYIVKVFGDDCSWAYASDLVAAANACAAQPIRIISMSLGGPTRSRTEERAFDSLSSRGFLSIAAAGNDGNNRKSYPASHASVISVAAVDSANVIASFSQFNDSVDLSAPGVGVSSTVPYRDDSTVSVGSTTYEGSHLEGAARGSATGQLVDGGICDSAGSWAGRVVLCARGTISFLDKVRNVEAGGGVAVVITNNVPGGFGGTLGAGESSALVALCLSQEDGVALHAGLSQPATVASAFTVPASDYEAWDGTSMATPHVSAVAALVWSALPSATAADVRAVLESTALDLGAAGRDNYYGHGLVQARAAVDALLGGGGGGPMCLASGAACSRNADCCSNRCQRGSCR